MGQVNSNAPGRGEDEAVFTTATDATDSSTSNMTAKEKCATDNNQGMAEWEKLADAPTIALPHSEMLAMQAGKGTRRAGTGTGIGMCSSENFPGETVEMAEQPEDQKDERHNKKAKMKEGEVETPQAADQGNTNATVEDWSPRFKAKTSSVGGEEKAVGAAAAAPASATMGGRGPLFVPGMTLEEKLNKAMALKVKRLRRCTFPTSLQGGLEIITVFLWFSVAFYSVDNVVASAWDLIGGRPGYLREASRFRFAHRYAHLAPNHRCLYWVDGDVISHPARSDCCVGVTACAIFIFRSDFIRVPSPC